uniref:FAD-binding domain-containing protein n=1 Tax=Chromera velia CCMP2878 TaxID=1169474 RepID=A0A0G4HAA5_9ALVE|eukprot:Cvel_25625.t1-p1 / transcript=Cvel_25625.t1 / gene=Cvel_25625 / organism=Chromera_velia_CCMP2878 / gene_product=hypothetical protein / transcript_product=hypothetical protein / location=Cvel_scaffold2928:15289-18121(-) / protein_length=472 / sequence_SO=supercontig / SO=protein_coding / is_pseudo=false
MEGSKAPFVIVGGGVGGWALALSLSRLGLWKGRVHLFERDPILSRYRGYSLTMQEQEGGAYLKEMGLDRQCREAGVPSAGYTTLRAGDGGVVFHGGVLPGKRVDPLRKRGNFALPREVLRKILHDAVVGEEGGGAVVHWGCSLESMEFVKGDGRNGDGVRLNFVKTQEKGEEEEQDEHGGRTSVVAGAVVFVDGLNSLARRKLIGDPLVFSGLRMINGICENGHALVQQRVLECVDGKGARIFTKPFDSRRIMWQLTHKVEMDTKGAETAAAALVAESQSSSSGSCVRKKAKEDALSIVRQWPEPVLSLIASTETSDMRVGYLFDREPLNSSVFEEASRALGGLCTFMGDAAHPMTPFKGQGANNALLDARELSACLAFHCRMESDGGEGILPDFVEGCQSGIRTAFREFEEGMVPRSAKWVLASRALALFAHTTEAVCEEAQRKARGKTEAAETEQQRRSCREAEARITRN